MHVPVVRLGNLQKECVVAHSESCFKREPEGARATDRTLRLVLADRCLVCNRPATAVANMEDVHGRSVDREENPIHMGLVAVEKLAHFKRKPCGSREPVGSVRESLRERQWRPPSLETSAGLRLRRARTTAIPGLLASLSA